MALQPATGMAVATLIVRSVTVTIRHNESEATASDAATAFDNFDDATRTERSPKPEPAICDRAMVENPYQVANHHCPEYVRSRCQDWGGNGSYVAKR